MMMTEEEIKKEAETLKEEVSRIKKSSSLKEKKERLNSLIKEISQPEIWQKEKERAEKLTKEVGELEKEIKEISEIEELWQEIKEAIEKDKENQEIERKIEVLKNKIREYNFSFRFQGKYDKGPAIVTIIAGAGGDDARDWVAILFEIYRKYAKKKGWQLKLIKADRKGYFPQTGRDLLDDITFKIEGDYAYGFLKSETGVHRLVRISPFSAKKLRHTSFAYVQVLPVLREEKIKIKPDDLKVEFFRSSGPGGQNVNKVETGVRLIHQPTGIVSECQTERSQVRNREIALQILQSRLYFLLKERRKKELEELKGEKVRIEWGHQIRSYIFQPYKLVKDHRTKIESNDLDSVLEGDLDIFLS